jgi:hypothetical protein
MAVAKPAYKPFSMATTNPYMIKAFQLNDNDCCQVDIYILKETENEDIDSVLISQDGMYLEIVYIIPEFFWEEDCVIAANRNVAGVNANTSLVTAHKDCVQGIRKAYPGAEVTPEPQRIRLPSKCRESVEAWEIMVFENGNIVNDGAAAPGPFDHTQYKGVLRVDVLSAKLRTARKVQGVRRVVGSPN